MSDVRTGHPDDGQLLRYADGELPAREAKEIRSHLAACWQCRAELEELERTAGECVRYRRSVLQPYLPDPPAPWFDIRRRLAGVEASLSTRSFPSRLIERLGAGASRVPRWAVAAMAVVAVWAAIGLVPRLRHGERTDAAAQKHAPAPAAALPHKPVEAIRPGPPPPARKQAPPPMEPAATAGDELRVLAVLRRLGADLGEPVEVIRGSGRVLVTGIGIEPELRRRLHGELERLPRVAVLFSDPAAVPLPPGGVPVDVNPPRPDLAHVQARLEEHLGGRAAYEQFSNEALETMDELMARMHALRRLAERFPPQAESSLAAEERELLTGLRREHAQALVRLAVALDERATPALRSLGGSTAPPRAGRMGGVSWQAATGELFQAARTAEALLAAILGGAASDAPPEALPAQVVSTVAQLRMSAEEYVRGTPE
jgi:hypothetical protein